MTDVCSGDPCGPPEAVKYCLPTKMITPDPDTPYSQAFCVCAEDYTYDSLTGECISIALDRCKEDQPCGPLEGVKSCTENRMTGKFICTCNDGYVLNARNNLCEKKCTDSEAAACGSANAHDADKCSVGITGRICACKEGYIFDKKEKSCVEDSCYISSMGWQEGVESCRVLRRNKRRWTCATGFAKNDAGECLPECSSGRTYNRLREVCELAQDRCDLEDCGNKSAVEACYVDRDSGAQICECKDGYGIDTSTGRCSRLPTCRAGACTIFGSHAVCISNGYDSFACYCVENVATPGGTNTIFTECAPVSCPDPSICGENEGVKQCLQTSLGHKCECKGEYKLNENTRKCEKAGPDFTLPKGSLRVSATRAPLQFTIQAPPCFKTTFDFSMKRCDTTVYNSVRASNK